MHSRVTILGPGLLGGSLALALKQRGECEVSVWARRPEALEDVRRGGIDNVTTELRHAVADADQIVLATPVGTMPDLVRQIAPHLKRGALIMDVGSVKAPVVAELTPLLAERGCFVGSHPMAGSEQTGFSAARADLFDGAVCIVTPLNDTPADRVEAAASFWRGVGCSVQILSPDEHDRVVAWISHLPHLLAAALVDAVAQNQPAAFDFCGPGFRDTTRVASGSPSMWTEILGQNREAVRTCVDGLIEKLRVLSTLLSSAPTEERDSLMNNLLTQAKAQRDRLRLPRNSSDV